MSIKVEHISKKYDSQLAINDISFEIQPGEIVGFLGPNGAGKSTLMKILTGYIGDFEGRAFVSGIEVGQDVLAAQRQLGYLPEHNPLYLEMYVREYLRFLAAIHKVENTRVEAVIALVGLSPEAGKKIKQLSKGYRQRVGIAGAVLHNPEVLILDEPTTGLDPNQLVEIRELIKSLGKDKTILFSTHIMQEVEAICDRVIVINKGNMVADENLNALRQGQDQIIEVEFDFRVEKKFMDAIPGLLRSNNFHDTHWELVFAGKDDMRPKIFDFAQENGLKILNMTSKNKNLESLFRELTT